MSINSDLINKDLLDGFGLENYPSLPVWRLIRILLYALIWKSYQTLFVKKFGLNKRPSFRAVSITHAIISVIMSLYILTYGNDNIVFRYPTTMCQPILYASNLFEINVSYFLYDLYKTITTEWGWDFVAHGSFSLTMYCIFLFTGQGHFIGLGCLLYEISTIMLHFYSFLFYAKYVKLAGIFRLLFAILFFLCRVLWGTYLTFIVWDSFVFGQTNIESHCLSILTRTVSLVINTSFHALNIYWLSLILKKALSIFKKNESLTKINENKLEFDKYRNQQQKKSSKKD